MKRIFFCLFLLFVANQSLAATPSHQTDQKLIRQQMVMLGLYVYGMDQELSKVTPDLDELVFLSDSILSIAERLKTAKANVLFHQDLKKLLKKAKEVKSASQKKKLVLAIETSKELMATCGECHRKGTRY